MPRWRIVSAASRERLGETQLTSAGILRSRRDEGRQKSSQGMPSYLSILHMLDRCQQDKKMVEVKNQS